MTTHVAALADTVDRRIHEIDVAIRMAELQAVDSMEYSVLCRSTVVLISAYMEGFSRDLSRSVVNDHNEFSSFAQAPKGMQRSFCRWFIDKEGKDGEDATKRLTDSLAASNVRFSPEAFLFDRNRNPAPAILERLVATFGVRSLFRRLAGSSFDAFFAGDTVETRRLLDEVKQHVTDGVSSFPYQVNAAKFGIAGAGSEFPPNGKKTRSLWEDWLDSLMVARHDVAHGKESQNQPSIADLVRFRDGALLLSLAALLVLCDHCRASAQ
jgi:hypothetical protein